jgi:hypothetical protein
VRSAAFFDKDVKCFGKKVGDFNKNGISTVDKQRDRDSERLSQEKEVTFTKTA